MRAVVYSLLGLSLLSTAVWAEETPPAPAAAPAVQAAAAPPPQPLPANKPKILPVSATLNPSAQASENKALTAEQLIKNKALQDAKMKALVNDQHSRLQQLEKANLEALAQNQELQLKNDSLGVQVQVLQSERSAQMFLYGAATIAAGVLLGFLIASYVYTKRRRQW
ncbi:hypothetical protein [Acinetobacter sp. ANC 3813]|uniref:hypothetical protein n=1 Tax=Acinetobacter sp. ANC 3813 TaxID=1977873 RepID=UPI000A354E5B|nr:hypothetical protein [Acinetobacter sp. ANC 3813]OTG89363.1 hypothetical protein B9T34_11855 [Acinetobacter sp. ANC 3813]